MAREEQTAEDRLDGLIRNGLRVAIPIRDMFADLLLRHVWHVCTICETPLSANGICENCTRPRFLPAEISEPLMLHSCQGCSRTFRHEETLEEHYANNPGHLRIKRLKYEAY